MQPENKKSEVKLLTHVLSDQGRKNDEYKLPMELLPVDALEEITKALQHGADKYGPYNWLKGMNWTRIYAAGIRHLFSWFRGEDKDPDTGLSHLAHAGCCVLFLLTYSLRRIGKDDRDEPNVQG